MDKLIFTNADGLTVEFSETSKYRWLNVDDLGGTDTISQSVTSPYQDGSTSVGDSYFKSKIIEVQFVVNSDNLNADMRTLSRAVNPKLGLGTLSVTVGSEIYVLNKVKTRTMPTRLGGNGNGVNHQFTSILFEVFDPLYTDADFTEQEAVSGENMFAFPLNITDEFEFDILYSDGYAVINSGDVECPVTITVDGAITAPLTIENVTTGESIKIILDLTSDEQLIITTEIDNINVIKKTISTGVEVSAFNYIDVTETTFFNIVKGTNRITITATGGDIEGANIKFKNRYVGI